MEKFHVNDRIEFRFVTRTLTDDYHVFGMEGRRDLVWGVKENRLPDEDEFAPLRKVGDIDPELGPCAVLFEYREKVYLVVSGMSRGENDRAGRVKRFSFCQIFDGTETGRAKAYAAFNRIVTSFTDAEKKMRELIREVPVVIKDWQGNEKPSEEIEFRQQEFIDWLQEKRPEDTDLKSVWPQKGYRLKWMKEASPDIMRERIDGFETSSKKWLAAVAILALLICVGCLWMLKQMSGGKAPQGKYVPPSTDQTVGKQGAPKESADEQPQVKEDGHSNDIPGAKPTAVTPEAPKVSGDNQSQVKEVVSSNDLSESEPTVVTPDTTKERDGKQSEDVSGVLSGDNTSDKTFEVVKVPLSKDIVSKDFISRDIVSNSLSDGGNAQ